MNPFHINSKSIQTPKAFFFFNKKAVFCRMLMLTKLPPAPLIPPDYDKTFKA